VNQSRHLRSVILVYEEIFHLIFAKFVSLNDSLEMFSQSHIVGCNK
jgi:hypothetical protein